MRTLSRPGRAALAGECLGIFNAVTPQNKDIPEGNTRDISLIKYL